MTIKEIIELQKTDGKLYLPNRVCYPGYRKVSLNDYMIIGNEAVPYFEFDKLKKDRK